MKKYRTLKAFESFWGEGAELDYKDLCAWFTPNGIRCLVKDKNIEEIQEPEFTRDDMEKAFEAGCNCVDPVISTNSEIFFNIWIQGFKNESNDKQ
jgi:hypothetical protein